LNLLNELILKKIFIFIILLIDIYLIYFLDFCQILVNFNHHLFLNDKLFTFLENIFYETVSARTESWQMGPYRVEMIILIDKILD
jgi:hypothetical protein